MNGKLDSAVHLPISSPIHGTEHRSRSLVGLLNQRTKASTFPKAYAFPFALVQVSPQQWNWTCLAQLVAASWIYQLLFIRGRADGLAIEKVWKGSLGAPVMPQLLVAADRLLDHGDPDIYFDGK